MHTRRGPVAVLLDQCALKNTLAANTTETHAAPIHQCIACTPNTADNVRCRASPTVTAAGSCQRHGRHGSTKEERAWPEATNTSTVETRSAGACQAPCAARRVSGDSARPAYRKQVQPRGFALPSARPGRSKRRRPLFGTRLRGGRVADPGADVAESRRRCGRVPAKTKRGGSARLSTIQPLLVTLLGCSRLTALHMAVQGGSWDSVDCLLKHNASQNVR